MINLDNNIKADGTILETSPNTEEKDKGEPGDIAVRDTEGSSRGSKIGFTCSRPFIFFNTEDTNHAIYHNFTFNHNVLCCVADQGLLEGKEVRKVATSPTLRRDYIIKQEQ